MRCGHEPGVAELAMQDGLLLDVHDLVERVGVASGPQVLLGPEVVPDQAAGDPGSLGDVADRGPIHAGLGDQRRRRVPDPRPGRQVLGGPFPGRACHHVSPAVWSPRGRAAVARRRDYVAPSPAAPGLTGPRVLYEQT